MFLKAAGVRRRRGRETGPPRPGEGAAPPRPGDYGDGKATQCGTARRLQGTGNPPEGGWRAPDGRWEKRLPGGFVPDEHPHCPKLSNFPGTLALVGAGEPNTGGSQFFINLAHNRWADFWERESPAAHCVFGKLDSNTHLDLARKIARAEADDDRPIEPIKIIRVRMGTPADHAAAAHATKEAQLQAVREGAKSQRFEYGTWD